MRRIAVAAATVALDSVKWLIIDYFYSDEGEDDEDEEKKPEELAEDAAGAAAEDDGDLSEAELERRRRLEYEEEDAPPIQDEKVQYVAVQLPKIPLASQTQKVQSYSRAVAT